MTALLAKLFTKSVKDLPGPIARHMGIKKRLDRKRSVSDTDFVVFDTELTGLNFKRDSIISIGAIKLRGGKILPGHTFYRLVRPESELNGKSVVVHGITHTDLVGAESLADALVEFIEFIGDAVLIGHFVNIDVNFVGRALKKHFGVALQSPAVDTSVLHDWLYENDMEFSRHHNGMAVKSDLFTLGKRYGLEVEESHNAFYDAYLTAQLFQRFVYFLEGCGIKNLNDLLAVGKP